MGAVESLCSFDLHFPNDYRGRTFSCVYHPFVLLLRRACLFAHLLFELFEFLVLNFSSSLYTLDTNPLSEELAGNDFLSFCRLYLHLLVVFLTMQNLKI